VVTSLLLICQYNFYVFRNRWLVRLFIRAVVLRVHCILWRRGIEAQFHSIPLIFGLRNRLPLLLIERRLADRVKIGLVILHHARNLLFFIRVNKVFVVQLLIDRMRGLLVLQRVCILCSLLHFFDNIDQILTVGTFQS